MDFTFTTGNNNELAKLNQYLSKNAYIEGFGPTQNDVKIFGLVPRNVSSATFPHVARWAANIQSFPCRVRTRWSKGKVTLDDSEEKKAAPQEKKGASRKSSEADKPASKAPSRKQSEADKKDSKPSSKAPSRKSSDADKKDSKKDKKNKKGKKQEEEEPAPIEEEPAVEEAAEEAPAEEEPVEEEENMSLDDLVADDDEDDEETKAMFSKQKGLIEDIQKRQAANAGKAKSNLTLDVKPYDTETDMGALEQKIRGIEMEGLKWLGASLIDVAYGIKKLRIMCQLVDVLVNPDSVREEIEKFEEEVQSTDIFAFQMA